MIISKAYDVEIFPNLFSIIFVDMKDYFNKFADCGTDALTERLSVSEIRRRLDTVKCDIFYISDTDDSQLLELVAYFNNMTPHYDTKVDDDGNVHQIPIRYDLFGFNNKGYDDYIIKAFLMYYNRFSETKYLIKKLKEISDKVIALQNDKELFYADKEIETISKYRLPYATVDVQQIYGLHAAGVRIDSSTGERIKYGKSLKQTGINLKWHEILDFSLPPIDEEEKEFYWDKKEHYKGLSLEHLNELVTEDFSRYVLPKYVEPMLHYNKNDVFIVCDMVRQKPDEVKLRYSITNAFGVNVLCSARANIADKLITKFYSKKTGLREEQFKDKRTERTVISFKRIILPHIKFKTKQLQDLLTEMKTVKVRHTTKDAFSRTINFYGTTYTIAMGGIHTVDPPRILKSTDKYVYIHHDYTSYYPSIMIEYGICPEHLVKKIFIELLRWWRDTRIKCKHAVDENVIKDVLNKIAAEALKIVINAIFGKLGSERFFLYDNLAKAAVTINGQLMTMTLCESLELAGIHVVSANTDGIVVKLPIDKREIYEQIVEEWNKENRMSADDEEYDMVVSRDVNNYFDIQKDGTIEYKGALDPKQYLKELTKGFDMPVVAIAVFNYFVHNKPVMDTLREHKDILDFCKTQNVGRQFEVIYHEVVNGEVKKIYSQRHIRFYVSTHGVIIQKEHKDTKKCSVLAGGLPSRILNTLDDKPIEERDIDYKYYYEECYKIIDPIKLGISPNQKADKQKGVRSGKLSIKKRARQYLTLFDEEDFE